MDWARDNASVGEKDMETVFSFEPRHTTVLRVLEGECEVSFLLSTCCLPRRNADFQLA